MKLFYFSLVLIFSCIQSTFGQLRVISLSPNTTAIIYDLMQLTPAQNITKLIATIDYPNAPAYYEAFEHVGRFQALDINKILTLNPDVVITWKNQTPPSIIELLQRFGLTVKIFNAETLSQLGESFKDIAKTIGLAENGIRLYRAFLGKLATIKAKQHKSINHSMTKRVFFQISNKPIFTIGGVGILNEVIEFCGGENVFKSIPQVSFEVSPSAVLMANPDMIIQLSDHVMSTENSPWYAWSFLKAVQSQQVFYLPASIISQYSPSIITGIQKICELMSDQLSQVIESYLKCSSALCLDEVILFPNKHTLSKVGYISDIRGN